MHKIITDITDGKKSVPVYSYHEIPWTDIMLSCQESKKRGRYAVSYLEIPCAFDIETTNIFKRIESGKDKGKIDSNFKPFSFMYHWQFCIGYRVVFGRRWEEFSSMLDMIIREMNLSDKLRLVVYVHNLSFEMQFMRKFLNVTESFCKSERAPLKIVHDGCIEFRCSAALSNSSLKMFCKAENAKYYKMVDKYNYKKIRTADTELTEEEQGYCYNDVRGLSECIQSRMRFDTLAQIPLTSTGYVRRDARSSMKKNPKNRRIFRESALDPDDYLHLRAAFRGGNTHANARFADQLLKNVTSYDIASSYPACMVCNKFPMSKFMWITMETYYKLMEDRENYVFLIHAAFIHLRFKADHGIPYIPLAKTKGHSEDRILDNGRIRKASFVTMWLSDVDLDIIKEDYDIEEIRFESVYVARADYLPEEFRNVVMDYFRAKTELKGKTDPESIYNYNLAKARVNALYGMLVMRIDQTVTEYTGEGETGYIETTEEKRKLNPDIWLQETLEDYYKKRSSFLCYQWGVWVTVWARFRLWQMMRVIGRDLAYIDTDSVKFLNLIRHQEDINNLNRILREDAIKHGAYADDIKGNRHYLGVFEHDGDYDKFKTLGAKKYVVQIGKECFSTIAGVSKEAGQKFFEKNGIDSFRIGAVIPNSGHLVAYYNDDDIHEIDVDGCKMTTASNVALIDDTYTIGVTDDYIYLLEQLRKGFNDLG